MSNGGPARPRVAVALAVVGVLAGTLAVSAAFQKPPVDYTGDHVSDFVLVRNTGGGPNGAITWWIQNTLSSAYFPVNWGSATDFFISGDYDGDGTTDVAIWRPGPSGTAGFWIVPSSTGIGYFVAFGQSGDDPTVPGDYDGDGITDLAVYRAGASAGDPSVWYYRRSIDGTLVAVSWGQNGDFPAPGDYDGDGKADFSVQRSAGGGNAVFITKLSSGPITTTLFGTPTDVIVPGDYDGDGKTDYAVIRGVSGAIIWFARRSTDGVVTATNFGLSATDFPTQGDYDGDGKTDVAVWRPSASVNGSMFWVNKSSGGVLARVWGANGDYPVANFNTH